MMIYAMIIILRCERILSCNFPQKRLMHPLDSSVMSIVERCIPSNKKFANKKTSQDRHEVASVQSHDRQHPVFTVRIVYTPECLHSTRI